MKCPNCGEENPEGMKFCGNCGTKLPEPKNHCPHCNKDWPLTMKFCGECGFKFCGSAAPKSAGISMGDKNVIAGDVIGSKDETHVSGNATIIKNEDETKKTARCHVCGRIVMRIDGFDCPVCGQFSCASCYDIQHGRCKSCMNQSESSKINQYKEAFKNYYSDQRIDLSERRELINLQHKLGLSDDKIKEIEASITKEASSLNNAKFTTVETININKVQTLYYDEGKSKEAINLLKPIYAMHKTDENILNLYFPILADIDEAQAENEIKQLSFDNLSAYLTIFDIALRKKEFDAAEHRLDKLVMLWPENVLVKCSQFFFKYELYKEFHEETFLQEAQELAQDLGTAETPLEKSYQEKIKFILEEETGSPAVNYTKDYCRQNGLYWIIMNDAVKLFNKVAVQGNDTADNNDDVKQLIEKAEKGDAEAQNALGDIYYYGWRGISENKSEAIKWNTKAAEQGNADAQKKLGDMYYYGFGVEKNYSEAKKWYTKATEQGNAEAKNSLIMFQDIPSNNNYKNENVVQNDNKTETITQNNNKTVNVTKNNSNIVTANNNDDVKQLSKNAEQSDSEALLRLAVEYEGKGICIKSIKCYKKAAEQGNVEAQKKLGAYYSMGICGVEKNYIEALKWWTKAAEHGDKSAKYEIGYIYEGLEDYNSAIKWYIQAEDSYAQVRLGKMYENGTGVAQNYREATKWYAKAAENGNAEGQFLLGSMYEKHLGDNKKALEWYTKAKNGGNRQASIAAKELRKQGYRI